MSRIFKNNGLAHGILATLLAALLIGLFNFYVEYQKDKVRNDDKFESINAQYHQIDTKLNRLGEAINVKNKGLNQRIDQLHDAQATGFKEVNIRLYKLERIAYKFGYITTKDTVIIPFLSQK